MQPIIGLDFGNFNTYACFISDFDEGRRVRGQIYDLNPPGFKEGIPSVYFYSRKVGEVLVGENAIRARAFPHQNRLRYLKRHLDETIVLDDRTISYNEAITEVVQHCIRSANEQLQKRWHATTNLVSLSYPASYTPAQLQRLIDLVQNATLANGMKVKVCGTIAEPAAAALDYLAEFAETDKDTTVLTYDLGGGTFDLGLVSVYPKGRKRNSGEVYYYDIINARGIANLGGIEFDEIIYKLLLKKVKTPLGTNTAGELRNKAETVKVALSTDTADVVILPIGEECEELPITRNEFENASKDLLARTIAATKEILDEHRNQTPEMILLSGGASQMPMVQRELERNFPQFKGKIISHRPSEAIAYGAARFGTVERKEDEEISLDEPMRGAIISRTLRDIGIGFTTKSDSAGADLDYVSIYIPRGTEIPFSGEFQRSHTRYENQLTSSFLVYEANKTNPDQEKLEEDWTEIMRVYLKREGLVPKGTESETRLIIDKNGRIKIDAREAEHPERMISNDVQLII